MRAILWAAASFTIVGLFQTGAWAAAPSPGTIPLPPGSGIRRPIIKPVTDIVIRGLSYKDHTANTSLSDSEVKAADFFDITTLSLFFSSYRGSLPKTIKVVLQDTQAPSASSGGITVFELTNVTTMGQILRVQAPDLPIFQNRTYHVTMFMYVADGTRHYASAGTLKVL